MQGVMSNKDGVSAGGSQGGFTQAVCWFKLCHLSFATLCLPQNNWSDSQINQLQLSLKFLQKSKVARLMQDSSLSLRVWDDFTNKNIQD